MIDEFIKGYIKNYRSYKDKWNYEDGCILKGAWDLYRSTGEESCKSFVLSYIDEFIDKAGNIKGYNPQNYHLDDINSGKVLFDLYGLIEDSRLTNAIESLYGQIRIQPLRMLYAIMSVAEVSR